MLQRLALWTATRQYNGSVRDIVRRQIEFVQERWCNELLGNDDTFRRSLRALNDRDLPLQRLPLHFFADALALEMEPDQGRVVMEVSLTGMVYWGYMGIMEKKMETTKVYWGYTGKMENRMETTIVYWGYMGIMENKMEITIVYPKPLLVFSPGFACQQHAVVLRSHAANE